MRRSERSCARREERRGPRVGAPDKAIQGFLKAVGLERIDQAEIRDDPKGGYYIATTDRPGRATTALIADIVSELVKTFPWPKSMRWGDGSLRWVRPLHSIVCTFAVDNDVTEIVSFAVEGVQAGDVTYGHRVHAPGPIRVRRFADYAAALEAAHVVLDADRRKDIILADARNLALVHALDLVEDEALLEEVAGLVEWPVLQDSEREVHEWWLVSDELAGRLQRAGQPVLHFGELNMWGRGTAGGELREDLDLAGALRG